MHLTQVPLQVEQTYSIKNTNFYSITLKNFDDLQISSAYYVGSNGGVFQFQASGIGPSSLTIDALQSATLTLLYNSTSTALDAVIVSSQCATDAGLPLFTSGSLDSTTILGYPREIPFSKLLLVVLFRILLIVLY